MTFELQKIKTTNFNLTHLSPTIVLYACLVVLYKSNIFDDIKALKRKQSSKGSSRKHSKSTKDNSTQRYNKLNAQTKQQAYLSGDFNDYNKELRKKEGKDKSSKSNKKEKNYK